MYTKRWLFITVLVGLSLSSCLESSEYANKKATLVYPTDSTRLKNALDFCTQNELNTNHAILVDLTKHSGNYRFFLVNLQNCDTLLRGLCTHGHCKEFEGRTANFSNVVGSNCSSLGRYKVGEKYTGSFGTSYKLHGLDSSNSNAYERFVVLHSHPCVPNHRQEDDICLSEGCPTISPNLLQRIEPYVDEADKSLLLWVYQRKPISL